MIYCRSRGKKGEKKEGRKEGRKRENRARPLSEVEDNTPMTLDNRYGMRVTEESAPGSDIGRPRDQSYRIIIVIATSVLPGSRETCDVEGEDFTVDKIPNTRCFNCLCKVKKKKEKKIYLPIYPRRFRFHYSPRLDRRSPLFSRIIRVYLLRNNS